MMMLTRYLVLNSAIHRVKINVEVRALLDRFLTHCPVAAVDRDSPSQVALGVTEGTAAFFS